MKFVLNKLQKSKGIGITYSQKLSTTLGFSAAAKLEVLDSNNKIRNLPFDLINAEQPRLHLVAVEKFTQERAFLIEQRYYKGVRYDKNLPARGQRTHTNAKTIRKFKKNA